MKSQFSTITKQSTFARVWSLHLIGHQPWIPSLVVLRILTEKAFHSIVARWAYSKFKERSALGVLAHISYYYKNGSLTEAHVCTLFLYRANRRSNLKSIFDCNFEPAEDSTEIAEVGWASGYRIALWVTLKIMVCQLDTCLVLFLSRCSWSKSWTKFVK